MFAGNPSRINVSTHLEQISKALDVFRKKYEDVLLMGDYNVDVKEANMNIFCNQLSSRLGKKNLLASKILTIHHTLKKGFRKMLNSRDSYVGFP